MKEHKHPIIICCPPKSGTHLIMGIMQLVFNEQTIFYGIEEDGTAILSVADLQNINKNKIYSGHFWFNDTTYEKIKNIPRIILIRDPRDNVISQSYFRGGFGLTGTVPTDSVRKFFENEKCDAVKISASIFGITFDDSSFPSIYDSYWNFAIRWMDKNSLIVRYEDLITTTPGVIKDNNLNCLQKMFDYCNINLNDHGLTVEDVFILGTDPKYSLTYRQGKKGSWKKEFSEHHTEEIKLVTQDLVFALGYEKNENWNLNNSDDISEDINWEKLLKKIDLDRLHNDFKKYITNITNSKIEYIAKAWYVKKLIELQDFEIPLKFIDDILEVSNYAIWNYYKALCLHVSKKESTAIEYYNIALQKGFNEFWIRYNRGMLMYELGNKDKAKEDLKIAYKLNENQSAMNSIIKTLENI